MSRKDETDGSLDPVKVLNCCYGCYRELRGTLGIDTEEFDDLPVEHQDAWFSAMNAGSMLVLDSEERGGVKWLDIAEAMYVTYHREAGHDAPAFAVVPDALRLIWEAMARNLANMLAFDEEEDRSPEPLIEKIVAWFETKATELGERMTA